MDRIETTAPRGTHKKEAFHQAAEEGVYAFRFAVPNIEVPEGGDIQVKLAETDGLRLLIQVVRNGGENSLHYHPNKDTIYMALKGRVRFYGVGDKVLGEIGPMDGLLLPENARYWFENIDGEEAWLLQAAGYPKGVAASKRVDCGPRRGEGLSIKVGPVPIRVANQGVEDHG